MDLWEPITKSSNRIYHKFIIEIYLLHSFFSKINMMQYERDTEWPEKLQPAVFAVNTLFKRSTTLIPFRFMFCRDCDIFDLLKLVIGSLEDKFGDDVSDDRNRYLQILLLWNSLSRCVLL